MLAAGRSGIVGVGAGRGGVILCGSTVPVALFAVGLFAGAAGGGPLLAALQSFLLLLFLGPVALCPLLVVVRFESHRGSPLGKGD
ncbi:hypothetical protein AZL_d02990 (plasmid) [Azospirillum sp. B510]|nr:hypothetical protein AZL_d02990 [Azospirillum sp. B510]